MKTRKPKRISRRMERLLQLQVQEYIDRYHPHTGNAEIVISPDGTVAVVGKSESDTAKRRNQHGHLAS